jgi:ABC-type histidine transport system ATPase subunit
MNMSKAFVPPVFQERCIELRHENGEVCIYGTKAGLKKMIDFCMTLLNDPKIGHIHLEDYEVLSEKSLKGTIAVFPG